MHIIDELIAREFIKDITDPDGLRERMSQGPITYYTGYDPTNTSLTVGNLVPLMLQAHIARAGHQPIVIMGAGTALVGDPSGKSKTRENVLTREEINSNMEAQRPQFQHFLGEPILLNNADWLEKLHYIEFLRDIGRHFSVNEMIGAETYAVRLRANEHLSFTEFNYRLVQAYDFLHLFREHDCQLQVSGSDQWGNCVAGTELIRKVTGGGKAWVLTAPLLLTSDGVKMGKTERGAVWLDPKRTAPFDYFQYWMNVEDALVPRLLKQFTFLDLDVIEAFCGGPIQVAKTKLAVEATALAHGRDEGLRALSTSMLLFGLDRFVAWEDVVPGEPVADPDVPTATLERAVLEAGIPVFKLLLLSGLAGSGKQAKTLAGQGGAYVNGEAATDAFAKVGLDALRDDGAMLLRAGKKKYCLVRFT
jgi:tyrosyl-tRNA synthetase